MPKIAPSCHSGGSDSGSHSGTLVLSSWARIYVLPMNIRRGGPVAYILVYTVCPLLEHAGITHTRESVQTKVPLSANVEDCHCVTQQVPPPNTRVTAKTWSANNIPFFFLSKDNKIWNTLSWPVFCPYIIFYLRLVPIPEPKVPFRLSGAL